MPSIADLFVSVSSDVSGAINGLTDVDQKVNGVSNSMQSAVPAGLALAGAATAVGAGFLDAISVAADFQQHMANVNALLDPTQVDTYSGALNNLALQLGKDTVFSADQAATAIGELIKAGVDVPTVLNGGAAAALNLAAATGTDIPTAAAFAGTALNTFHESADQLTHTVDVLTGVANSSAASIDSLKLGFAAVGPVAAAIGLSFDDTATALGVFANNGLQGSDAGTSLKTMLLNLEPATKSQKAAQAELNLINADGTSKFFDASGSAKSMSEIFQILKDSTSNLTAEQKTNLLQTAFGTDAVRAAAIAASEGADGFNKLSAQVQIEGLAAQEAATRQASLEGSMNQLNGSLETAKITIGDLFLPVLKTLVDFLTSVVNAFLTLPAPVQDAIVAIVGIAGAVAGFLAAWILVGPMLKSVAAGFDVILGAILPLLGPLALIAAAAALLYAAWQDDFGGIREVTQQVWEAIQPAFQNILNFLGTLRDTFGPVFQNMTSAAGPLIEQLSQALAPILAQLPGAIKSVGDEFNRMGVFLGQVADVVRFLVGGDFGAFYRLLADDSVPIGFVQALTQIHAAFDAIGPVVQMVAQTINFLITGNMDRLVELMQEGLPQPFAAALQFLHDVIVVQIKVWGDLLGGIKDFVGFLAAGDLQGAFNSLISTFGKIKDDILPLWNEFLSVLGGLLQALGPWIGDRVGDMWVGLNREWLALPDQLAAAWEVIKSALAGLVAQLPGVLGLAAKEIWGFVLGNFSSLPGQAVPVWETIKKNLGGLMGQLPGALATAAGAIWEFLLGVFSSLPGLAVPLWETIKENLGGLMGQLGGSLAAYAGAYWDFILGYFSALPGLAVGLWETIKENLGGLMGQLGGSLAASAGNYWDYLLGLFSALPGLAVPLWETIKENLGGLMSQLPGALATAAGDIWSGLTGAFGGLIEKLRPYWEDFTKWFGELLGGIPQFVIDHVGDVFGGIVDQATKLRDRIAAAIDPIRQLLQDTFGNLWSWITNGTPTGTGSGGGAGGFGGDGTTGGTTGAYAPLINIGTLIINSQEEADAFLNLVAQAVLNSANRVTVPSGGATPVL